MVGYDEIRAEGNSISIRTAEHGDMGSITIPGITFPNIPGFYTMNEQDMNKFLAEMSKTPIEGDKSLLQNAGVDPEDVEKVMQGNIRYKGEDGLNKEQRAWVVVYNKYDKEHHTKRTEIALITEKGWYAKTEPKTVQENPKPEPMESKGFPSEPQYTPATRFEGKTHLEKDQTMPKRILLS